MSEYNMPEGAHDSQHETGRIEDPPEMTIAEQRRAEIESCPEFVRVYIMGLEAAAKKLERLRDYDMKLQEAIIAAHVSGLPENWEFQDPLTTVATLARQCSMLRDSEVKFSHLAWDWQRRFEAICGPDLEACRIAQDAEHGGPSHDDCHTPVDWAEYIREFTGRAEYQGQFLDNEGAQKLYQANLVHVAGLAIAALLSARRKASHV